MAHAALAACASKAQSARVVTMSAGSHLASPLAVAAGLVRPEHAHGLLGVLLATFLGMGIVTYLPRALPMLGLSRVRLPRLFMAWLAMVPAAVLAALLAQSLVRVGPALHGPGLVQGLLRLHPRPLDIGVAVPCLVLALRTRSMMLVVLVGMVLVVIGRAFGL